MEIDNIVISRHYIFLSDDLNLAVKEFEGEFEVITNNDQKFA